VDGTFIKLKIAPPISLDKFLIRKDKAAESICGFFISAVFSGYNSATFTHE
jgi:hypothetical protein